MVYQKSEIVRSMFFNSNAAKPRKEIAVKQKVIIVNSLNCTPEEELEKRLQEFGESWRVVSATTSLALQGSWNYKTETSWMDGIARHAYYVTTVIVERVS